MLPLLLRRVWNVLRWLLVLLLCMLLRVLFLPRVSPEPWVLVLVGALEKPPAGEDEECRRVPNACVRLTGR